ncbi:MAG: hypothetical protein A3J63_04250 [Candidatus Moranbacteria bacterium RIFCSPHIGHO2_02_FULL_40_12b]|nr:MAG: hypothetical protein A3J63_04250 [Candidatus Moranbacteria bacterium RIFCSPHIGHO2_02_FULL_40_12b]OGI23163.1 MAG: hypothetical protein A3E91_03090 [Candidatus Moranbacteria bacterium RIFCSPHIGHO2_12_FULL_40_10]
MAIKISKKLIGKWLVYYGASGFAAYFGKVVDVNETDKEIKIADGLTGSKRYCNSRNCEIFKTKKQAVEEYQYYQPENLGD